MIECGQHSVRSEELNESPRMSGGLKYAGRACATYCSAEKSKRAEAAQAPFPVRS